MRSTGEQIEITIQEIPNRTLQRYCYECITQLHIKRHFLYKRFDGRHSVAGGPATCMFLKISFVCSKAGKKN
jgi:hypothetical protein